LRFTNFFIETGGRANLKELTQGIIDIYSTASDWPKVKPGEAVGFNNQNNTTNRFISGHMIAPSSDQGQYSVFGLYALGNFRPQGGDNPQQYRILLSASVSQPQPNADIATDMPSFEFGIIGEAHYFNIPSVTGSL
jgi:hypothetical protein